MSNTDLSINILKSLSQGNIGCKNEQEPLGEINNIHECSPLLESGKNNLRAKKTEGASWLVTSFLIVNAALGIGILNFPAAYNQAGGIFSATFIQIVMIFLMVSTMLILAYCSDVNGDKTYHAVLYSMCGKKGQRLAAVSITITLYCVCVAILIVIGDQLDCLFSTIYGTGFCNDWYLDRTFTISATAICLILPTCFFKSVDFLGCIGSIGIFAMLYPVFLTVYGYYTLGIKPSDIKTVPDNYASMFAVFPVLGLGYQSQEVVIPIYSCMKKRNLRNFMKSSVLAMCFLFAMYSIIGCFGYLTFGSKVSSNIMKMYDAKDPFVMVGVGTLIIKMIVTYPILALCGRDAVAGLYAEIRGVKLADLDSTEKSRRYVCAFIWFSTSLILAVSTNGIGIVIKYMGSIASINIFVFPGLCLMKMTLKKDPDILKVRSRLLIVYSIFIAAIGAFLFGVVLFSAILHSSEESQVNLCVRKS